MAKARFYVVIHGRNPGVFDRWDGGAREQVDGFTGALHKSFASLELAERWWNEQASSSGPLRYHFELPSSEPDPPTLEGRYFTYLIVDPRDAHPFYVGQTQDLAGRAQAHLQITQGKQKPYKAVIAAILAEGLMPEFRVVDEQPTEVDSLRSETEWVKRLAAEGVRVLNRWREHQEWIEVLSSNRDSVPPC